MGEKKIMNNFSTSNKNIYTLCFLTHALEHVSICLFYYIVFVILDI